MSKRRKFFIAGYKKKEVEKFSGRLREGDFKCAKEAISTLNELRELQRTNREVPPEKDKLVEGDICKRYC